MNDSTGYIRTFGELHEIPRYIKSKSDNRQLFMTPRARRGHMQRKRRKTESAFIINVIAATFYE